MAGSRFPHWQPKPESTIIITYPTGGTAVIRIPGRPPATASHGEMVRLDTGLAGWEIVVREEDDTDREAYGVDVPVGRDGRPLRGAALRGRQEREARRGE